MRAGAWRVPPLIARAILAAGLLSPWPATAWEALDGRIQVHGYGETQIRTLNDGFEEQLDLSQWSNILNVDVEIDALPEGWGPIDLLSFYVRAEGRYDCIYTHGCGMFRSVNTYGDDAHRLPDRLSDAEFQDYTGVLQTGPTVAVNPTHRTQTLNDDRLNVPGGLVDDPEVPESALDGAALEHRGFPGMDDLKDLIGGDDIPNTADDPFRYTMARYLDHVFAFTNTRGPDGGSGRVATLGPWLPKNAIVANAALRDRANPFRGRLTPSPEPGVAGFTRYHTADPVVNGVGTPSDADLTNPYFSNPDRLPAELIPFLPPDLVIPGTTTPGTYLLPNTNEAILTESTALKYRNRNGANPFGGDYSGIAPCVDPEGSSFDLQVEVGAQPGCLPMTNIRVTGGTGELPLRPAPDLSNLAVNLDPRLAQGLYIPSQGLIQQFDHGDFDSLDMSFTELERSWNRGASQQDLKELKEAYVDIEWLDHRLWTRIGVQNIVWGKTELFRITDQFNPQDLALSTLPSLEESRIGLLGARMVYSFYDVGPLDDVRLEGAFNFDQFQPADLGACGEPYTVDAVCELSLGAWSHGYLGVGVAGVDRPENPWDDIDGLEFGFRAEGRWNQFSFALTYFDGYDDFPTPHRIMSYERNVDILTGRPLITRFNPSARLGSCAIAAILDSRDLASVTPAGIGIDPDCLKMGTPLTAASSGQQNALQWHHANQQMFAWFCSVTIGSSIPIDPGACGINLFNTSERLSADVVQGSPAYTEIVSTLVAGESRANGFHRVITNSLTLSGVAPLTGITPFVALNRDANDGFITAITGGEPPPGTFVGTGTTGINQCQGAANCNVLARLLPSRQDYLTLDSVMTNEQRGLFGCGPLYGTRCDTAANLASLDCSGPGCQMNFFFRKLFWNKVMPAAMQEGGGIDFLNADASAFLQSFPGFEGTPAGYITTNRSVAPGTIDFRGGPVCTRYVPGQRQPVTLPGCRGIDRYDIDDANLEVVFTMDPGYDPRVDGCILGPAIGTHSVALFDSAGNDITGTDSVRSCFGLLPVGTGDFTHDVNGNPVPGAFPSEPDFPCNSVLPGKRRRHRARRGGQKVDEACRAEIREFLDKRNSDSVITGSVIQHASTLFHPLAGCFSDADLASAPASGPACDFVRNLEQEFLDGTAQIFQNEMAGASFNFLMLLVNTSACETEAETQSNPECFDPATPWKLGKCSWNEPQNCSRVKEFFALTGVTRNTLRAAGNPDFGRRTFLWHSGGEVVLKYGKRNVLGFAMDFSEDITKSSWGMEFSWMKSVPTYDADEFDGITKVDNYNLTVSIDRPTFIHFLNPNRTFFFNTQWFFRYIPKHRPGMSINGPFNALFTFTVLTGYFQDRLNPAFTSIYDFGSRSGGFLPSAQYRFTDSFSVTVGLGIFFGRTQLVDMSVNPVDPVFNRAGPDAYRDGSDQFLSGIRRRDEAWLRLRWTF